MSREELPSNSSLMVLKSLFKVTTGRTTVSQSKETVETATSELKPTAHQDGGNSGDTKVPILLTKKERSSMSQEVKMTRTETSLLGTDTTVSTNNGTSSTPMNTQLNQSRENTMKTSVSMLKETSTLYLR
jgi:hypothetical protein